MTSRFLSLLVVLSFAPILHAQPEAPPKYQIYGGYSFFSNSLNGVPGSHHPLNGWDAGVGFPSWHNLRFKIDVSGYTGTNLGGQQKPYFILGGGEYSRRLGRETIFAEGLGGVGGANRNWGANASAGETASFSGLLGGGLDTRLTRRLAFRVEGDFQYAYFALGSGKYYTPYRIPGLPTNFGRVTSGVVINF
jgi:hypothetical protein